MRPPKIRYFNNEEEILAAIEKARVQAKKALASSEAESTIAKTCYHEGPNYKSLGDDHSLASRKWAREYIRLTEKTIPALSQKLAEIRTPVLFNGMDSAIPRRTRKPTRK